MSHTKGKLTALSTGSLELNGKIIATANSVEYSKLISLTWNSHDALVDALEATLPEWRGLATVSKEAERLVAICESALKSAKEE